jgi:hypothetical protein
MPPWIPSKCEQLGIFQCSTDNVKCGIKTIAKDNLTKNKVKG